MRFGPSCSTTRYCLQLVPNEHWVGWPTTICATIESKSLTDTVLAPAYVVRTFDRSSTYGAEVWYLLYPYRRDDPDGPWNLVKLPTDRPSAEDIAPYLK